MNKSTDFIDPHIRQSLEQLAGVPPRDPQAAARGRARFLAQAELLSRGVSRPDVPRHTGWKELLQNLFARKERFAMPTLMTVVVIVSLVFGGSGAVVYAAQDDLPTDALYGIKTWSEEVRLGLTGDPQARVALSLEFANRRAQEIEALNARGVVPPEPLATRLQAHLDTALQLAAGMDDAGLNRALTRVRATIEQQTQRMAMVQANAPEQARPVLARVQTMLAERRALAQMGLTDPRAFRQRAQTRSGEPQPQPVHTPGSGLGAGVGISQTVMPGNGLGPGPGISLTVAPGNGFGPGPGISLTVAPGNGFGPGPGISVTVTPGNGFGPGPGISVTVTPGNGFGPGPGISPTVPPGGAFGPGPGISSTVTPGNGFGPGPGISQTVTPGGGYGPGPQATPTPGNGGGGPRPTLTPGGGNGNGGAPQPTPEPTAGGNPPLTPIPGRGGYPTLTPRPGSGGSSRP